MSAQLANSNLHHNETTQQLSWLRRAALFILFLLCEAAIFIFGSNYFVVFPTNKNLTYNLITSAIFLTTALLLRSMKHWKQYWLVAYAFFVASVAYPSTLFLDVERLLGRFALTPYISKGLAIGKLIEVIVVVVPILVLTKFSGADFRSIYLKPGNLKLGMGIGWLMFFFLASASFMFAAQRFTSVDTLVAAVMWGSVFSFANSFMEELWLRGIFLKRFEPMMGINASVWLTSIIFASMHSFAFYFMPTAIPFFLVNTLTLGLACGYLMVKSESIWGAVVIHAASDFFLFVALLANA